MLKKNKVLILISILVLMLSVFALSACSNKTANKTKAKIYDANGLPLTKEAALKLWQGKWHEKNQPIKYCRMNEIGENGTLSVLATIRDNGKPNTYFTIWPSTYENDTKTLILKSQWLNMDFKFRFIDPNTLEITDNNGTSIYTRVIE